MSNGNSLIRGFLSYSKDGLVTTSYADDYIVRGYGFSLQRVISIGNGSTKYLLVDPSNYTGDSVFGSALDFSTTAGAVYVYISTNHDYSGGDELTTFNRNLTSNNTAATIITENPTGTNDGGEPIQYIVGTASTNQNSGGATRVNRSIFILSPAYTYLVKIVNSAGEDINFEIDFTWFEI